MRECVRACMLYARVCAVCVCVCAVCAHAPQLTHKHTLLTPIALAGTRACPRSPSCTSVRVCRPDLHAFRFLKAFDSLAHLMPPLLHDMIIVFAMVGAHPQEIGGVTQAKEMPKPPPTPAKTYDTHTQSHKTHQQANTFPSPAEAKGRSGPTAGPAASARLPQLPC